MGESAWGAAHLWGHGSASAFRACGYVDMVGRSCMRSRTRSLPARDAQARCIGIGRIRGSVSRACMRATLDGERVSSRRVCCVEPDAPAAALADTSLVRTGMYCMRPLAVSRAQRAHANKSLLHAYISIPQTDGHGKTRARETRGGRPPHGRTAGAATARRATRHDSPDTTRAHAGPACARCRARAGTNVAHPPPRHVTQVRSPMRAPQLLRRRLPLRLQLRSWPSRTRPASTGYVT